MKNLNKVIALGLLLFLFSGIYFFSKKYDPSLVEDEDFELGESMGFEELFGFAPKAMDEDEDEGPDYRIETFKQDKGWGYKIYIGKKIVVDQKHIPAISGVISFFNEEQAEKTGNFVLEKIKEGIMPPTITVAELDSLGIDY